MRAPSVRRLPCRARGRLEDLPGSLRQEQVFGLRLGGRAPGGDPGLCRPGRDPPGRPPGRRAPARLRPRPDGLRSLAPRARAGPQAGGAEERRALQGMGPADLARARPAQAPAGLGWRQADGQDPRRGAERRPRRGGGGLRRGARGGRPLGRRDPRHPGPAARTGAPGHDHDPGGVTPVGVPSARRLAQEPVADCARYDSLRRAAR